MPQGKGTYGSKVGRPRKKYEGGGMTAEERRQTNEAALMKSIIAQIDREEKNYPQKELDRSRNNLIKNASSMWSKDEIEGYLEAERKRRFEERRETAIEGNPLLEKRQIRNEGGATKKDSKEKKVLDAIDRDLSFFDYLNEYEGDLGKYGIFGFPVAYRQYKELMENTKKRKEKETQKEKTKDDTNTKRVKKVEGGELDNQMSMLMEEPVEEPMIPDEEMEEDYVDYVMQETLSNEDRNYLISALEKDDRLSEIFDQVVESATEFSGSGPIEGPGSGRSDSIPARLSDGEFVFTAKATDEIGSDNLMSMMKDAEAAADERQGVAYGGMVEEEGDPKAVPIQTTGSQTAQRNVPNVVKPNRQVEEEMLKASPRRYYVPLSG